MKKWYLFFIPIVIFFIIKQEKEIKFIPNEYKIISENYNVEDKNKYFNSKYEKIFEKNVVNLDDFNYESYKDTKITKKEIKEDLDLFIYTLQTKYAYYDRFGGDAEFIKRKNNLLESIKEKEISSDKFAKLLSKNFDNIYDFHFFINDYKINEEKRKFNYYMSKKTLNEKDLKNICEEDKEKYIKYTLDKNGDIKYTVVSSSLSNDDIIEVFLKDNKGRKNKYVLYKLKPIYSSIRLDYKIEKNYDYIYIRTFSEIEKDNYYENLSSKLKKADKDLIIDFRGNKGGMTIKFNPILKKYYSNSEEILNMIIGTKSRLYLNDETEKIEWENINGDTFNKNTKINKDTKIYILVDRKTFSAPEIISLGLKLVDFKNVIIIGTNSGGSIISNVPLDYRLVLPNSKIMVNTGITYRHLIDRAKELTGLEPDIWLDSYDDKYFEKIEKFIEKNK